MTQPRVHAQFDEATHTVSYVVWDPATRRAAIIDPVLDYDHRTGRVSHRSADDLLGFAGSLRVVAVAPGQGAAQAGAVEPAVEFEQVARRPAVGTGVAAVLDAEGELGAEAQPAVGRVVAQILQASARGVADHALGGIEQTEQMFEIHLTEQMFGFIMQISDKARKATHSTRRAPHMWKSDFSLNLI